MIANAIMRMSYCAGFSPEELLHAVGNLCLPGACEGPAYSQRMVALLIDGLRYGAGTIIS